MHLTVNDSGLPLYHTSRRISNVSIKRFYLRLSNWFRSRSFLMKTLLLLIPVLTVFITVRLSQATHEDVEAMVDPFPPEIILPKDRVRFNLIEETIVESKKNAAGVTFEGPTNERQRAVVKAFKHAWEGYKVFAWGHDQLKPVSKSYSDWFDTGLTIVDALDTAIIMGLEKEVSEATEWVREKLNFEKDRVVNFFECTIRVLGGLLSAFHLTGEKIFLEKSIDLGDRLLAAFKSSSPVPYSDVNLLRRTSTNPQWGADSSLSEVSTVQLEFRDLSRSSGNLTYEELAFKTSKHIHEIGCKDHDGLCGMFINANTGNFKKSSTITFGARSDSYYEYLFKQWLQTGKTIEWLRTDYEEAMNAMEKQLYRNSEPNKLYFIGELLSGDTYSPKMDHLVCFIAGTLALGSKNGFPQKHLDMAEKIGETCHEMYKNPTGLGPEIAHFNMIPGKTDLYVKPLDAHCLLRPEAIEAWFYLYRITGNAKMLGSISNNLVSGDKKYQEWGWSAFASIEKYAKIPTGGYSSISNVKRKNVSHKDMMESFFLAETLKYLYLLLGDDQNILPLNQWVFNTEGHPLPIYDN